MHPNPGSLEGRACDQAIPGQPERVREVAGKKRKQTQDGPLMHWAELHKKPQPVTWPSGTTLGTSYGIFAPWDSLLGGGRDVYVPVPYHRLSFTGKDSPCGTESPPHFQ